MDNKSENKKGSKTDLNFFFIKLFSISVAIVLIINFLFNTILADRLDRIDKILSFGDKNSRFETRDKIRSELTQSLDKENLIDEQDKILLYKLYLKIRKEFKHLDKSKL